MLLLVLSVFTAGVGDGAAQNTATAGESDEQTIRAVIAATTEAFSRHDAKAWVRFCTPDAQLGTVRGESMKGIAAIEKGLTAVFQTRARNATLEPLDVAVRFIRPDVALAHVRNQMIGLLSPEGQALPPHTELSIRVLVKDEGTWRITPFHNTIIQH
jgi:uncharacterized protein (TIGR02246 family)